MPGTGFLAMRCQPHYHSLAKGVYIDSLRLILSTLKSLGRVWQGPPETPRASLASHLAALSAPGRGHFLHAYNFTLSCA